MDEEKLTEYILKAVQAGKQETSGLVSDLKKQFGQDHDLLVRVHTLLETGLDDIKDLKMNLVQRVDFLEKDIIKIRGEVSPIRKVVYGIVTVILTIVIGAMVYQVIIKP